MKIFTWTPMEQEPAEDRGLSRPCLLWVYDAEISIGYTDGLAYWVGGRWVDHEERPIANHPDITVTQWCYVPKSRRSKKAGRDNMAAHIATSGVKRK